MNFQANLETNRNIIQRAKKFLKELDRSYFDLVTLNEIQNSKIISIVMTTHNRAVQTYYTLDTIKKSNIGAYGVGIQVIIVDDSPTKLDLNKLKQYGFQIDYITIKNKFWVNCCVNYNLGFKFIKGSKVIIQNSEVCHIGDIICCVNKNLDKNKYIIFDVLRLANLEENNLLYQAGNITWDYIDKLQKKYCKLPVFWYQHYKIRNLGFHFMTAISKVDLDRLGGFDIEFCVNPSYDDTELIFRIREVFRLEVVNIESDRTQLVGIHQWHTSAFGANVQFNKTLLDTKMNEFRKTRVYPQYIS